MSRRPAQPEFHRLWLLFVCASSFALALGAGAATPATSGPSAPVHAIAIRNFHFEPARLVVPVGATVTWTNDDEEPHVVASVGGRFANSPALDTHDRYGVTFTKPGTYAYFCSVHPFMTGTIVVR